MTIAHFIKSLSENEPPSSLSIQLNSLWYDAKGNWTKAHDLINDLDDKDSAWVHAYLHRKEGDNANAGYWYRRAGKTISTLSLEEERKDIIQAFLEK